MNDKSITDGQTNKHPHIFVYIASTFFYRFIFPENVISYILIKIIQKYPCNWLEENKEKVNIQNFTIVLILRHVYNKHVS